MQFLTSGIIYDCSRRRGLGRRKNLKEGGTIQDIARGQVLMKQPMASNIPVMPMKHEYEQQHHESEFVEVEEEPYSEPQEEWEKDIPPFLRKLSTMVNDNRGILQITKPCANLW